MHPIQRSALLVAILAGVLFAPAVHADSPPAAATGLQGAPAPIVWPATALARHAQAYFAQLAGDEAGARAFFARHLAPAALEDAGIETRLQRRRGMLQQTAGLTPLELVEESADELSVRCVAGNGDNVLAHFRGEPAPPHLLLGVSLEASPNGPGERRQRAPEGPPLDDAAAARAMREHLDARAAAGEFSGVALLVRGGAELMSGAWGLADRERRTPITPTTRFNLASIGKLFTRAAIAQLAEAGRLSLDDALAKYLPDFPHADSITIEMLCSHRSGVGDFFNAAYEAMDRSQLRHNRDYLALVRDQPLWFAPGTAQRYSNGGYVLLGEVIAKAAGEDYYAYLDQHVFRAADMTATGYPIEGDGTQPLARGYTREGAAPGSERDNAATRPARGSAAGGGYSTAPDLLAFDRALFAGRLCSPAWAAWVAGGPRPRPGEPDSPEPPMAGFAGGAPGIATEWTHEADVTLIVLTNRDPELTEPVAEALRNLLQRMRKAGRP